MLSSVLAAWRVAAFIFEENFGHSALPIFRTRREQATSGMSSYLLVAKRKLMTSAAVSSGYGEPGVKRGMPNMPLEGANGRAGGHLRKTRPSGDTAV
jgi:hypothetical protein